MEELKTNLMKDGKSSNAVQSYLGYVIVFLKYIGTMGDFKRLY